MDSFDIQTAAGAGTTVTVTKRLLGVRTFADADRTRDRSGARERGVDGPFEELQLQNQELMRALRGAPAPP